MKGLYPKHLISSIGANKLSFMVAEPGNNNNLILKAD
jgi:hypothetical protein